MTATGQQLWITKQPLSKAVTMSGDATAALTATALQFTIRSVGTRSRPRTTPPSGRTLATSPEITLTGRICTLDPWTSNDGPTLWSAGDMALIVSSAGEAPWGQVLILH